MFIALVLPVHRTPYGVQCVETLVYKHCAPLERARKTDRSACAKQTGSRVQKPTGPRTQKPTNLMAQEVHFNANPFRLIVFTQLVSRPLTAPRSMNSVTRRRIQSMFSNPSTPCAPSGTTI